MTANRDRSKATGVLQASTRRAFTLIELLVVIAIIAILAAILFPVFARARENARRSSCASNLRQVALGIKQYVQDNDEKYPVDGAGLPVEVRWAYSIQPYVKSEQLFQCPSEPSKPIGDTIEDRAMAPGFTDYWYNFNLGPEETSPGVFKPVNESQLAYASNVVMNGDGTSSSAGAAYTASSAAGAGSTRHLDGANYAFADAHIKWLKPNVVLTSTSDCPGNNSPNGSNATMCLY